MTGDSSATDAELTDHERAVLAFESRLWKYRATKDRAIREDLGLEPIDYYLTLDRLVGDPRAVREFPSLLSRLAVQIERDTLRMPGGAR